MTPVNSIKGVVRSSVMVPEFDKLLKKVGGHICRSIVEITIKMKTIVRNPLMLKIQYLVTSSTGYILQADGEFCILLMF